ncbi:histidine kinase [Hymenobacter busanensis]|uniref:Histidine kinase n=1 Tax=Hymenobacter busanensis TaxID=2607656 RepID=A0A7L4ZW50_9BACT|nr:histidine kinase [Hymenobacter busanensis]KAA9339152.1 histidine kinase [Hymenobacter busanensis]QHJ07086.1 histidine kinase [Hymenobacter busanensis]
MASTSFATPRRRRLYWLLQSLGWALYGLLGLVLIVAFSRKFQPFILLVEFYVAITLLGLSHLLRNYAKRHDWLSLPVGALFWRLLIAHTVVAALSQVIIGTLSALSLRVSGTPPQPFHWMQFIGYAINVEFVMWLWSLLYFGQHYLERYRQVEIDKWKLTAAVREAEMQTLKAQINPHFLFNGLNNIRSLIGEDPDRARDMLSHLSELLRYAIQLNRTEQVPLGRELAVVRDYLQLESLQLEERLRYTIDVPADCLAVQVPPMLVQVLVENAIKHGLSSRPAGGELHIQACCTGAELQLRVENTGQLAPTGHPKPDGTGTGVHNVRERLRLLFGERAELRLEQAQPDTVAAQVRIPLQGTPVAPAPTFPYATS